MAWVFDTSYDELDLAAVRRFLDDAGEEGITWEAKAEDDRERQRPTGSTPGRLRPRTIVKAACGMANQLGGQLILGARRDPNSGTWDLPGITVADPEPELWTGRILRDALKPLPRFRVKAWPLENGATVIVADVDPVLEPPCLTSDGRAYERVSGETRPVTDPVLLDAMLRRGRDARASAEDRSDRAARAILDSPHRRTEQSVGVSVALAAVGNQPADVAGRLFTPATEERMRAGFNRELALGLPAVEQTTPVWGQDHITLISTSERHRWWMTRAQWDGAVAVAAGIADGGFTAFSAIEQLVLPGSELLAALVEQLGGYGPASLTVRVEVAVAPSDRDPSIDVTPEGVRPRPAPPPAFTLFADLPELTVIRRWVDLRSLTGDEIGSLHCELQRAAGRPSYET